MHELEESFREAVEKADVGEQVNFNLKGYGSVFEIVFTHSSGWGVTFVVRPGSSFSFIKGLNGNINVDISIVGSGTNN
tara:strand:- start:48087 stop:48320 length:234 start_codon:yes stop_codon:yes gene_type:complete